MSAITKHIDENTAQLEKFKEEYRSKFIINFGVFFDINAALKSKKVCLQRSKTKSTGNSNNEPTDLITSKEAAETLRKKLSEEGGELTLKRIPEGRSTFRMGETKSVSRPINIFYDSGCSGILLREGVQQKLGTSVRKQKGPSYVRGDGNSTVKVIYRWT